MPMREFHPLLVYLAVSSTPILCRPPQSPVDAFRLRLRTRGPSPRSCMYALLSSSSTGHRTSSPLSSQIQDEMPYIHCTCATRHGPFQPQLTSAASAETRASALFRHVRRASDAFRRAASMHHRPRHDRSADTHHDLCPHHHRGGPFSSHLHDGTTAASSVPWPGAQHVEKLRSLRRLTGQFIASCTLGDGGRRHSPLLARGPFFRPTPRFTG